MSMMSTQGQAVQIVNKYLMPDGTLQGFASFKLAQGSPTTFVIDMVQFGSDKDGAIAVVQAFINTAFIDDGRSKK